MKTHFLFFCFFLSAFFSFSQSDVLQYARKIVDTLASRSMYGRGYVNKGDSIAADFIKKEFEKLEVKQIGKEFYQRFSLNVNTFPGIVTLKMGEKESILGKDFIPYGNSGTKEGKFETVWLNKKIIVSKRKLNKYLKKDLSKKVLVVASSGYQLPKQNLDIIKQIVKNTNGVIEIIPKLTADVSSSSSEIAKIYLDTNQGKFDTVEIKIQNKFIPNYQSQNIIGYIGGSQAPDSFLVFTAHYDHLGMMGKDTYFPGANDNASGVAMLLSLAKYYSEHKPKYSVAFIAFGAEEVGLLGSKYFTEHPLFSLKKIKFLVNFDIVGTGDEGIKVVNSTEHKKEFEELVKINSEKNLVPSVNPRGKAAISDHHPFDEKGVKTFYIYTLGGIKAYHDIYDKAETLPLTEFEDLYKLMIEFSSSLQN